MDRVRQAVHAEEAVRRGLSGKGVTVAVLDTGLSPGPDFYGRIVKFVDLVNGRKACYDDSSHEPMCAESLEEAGSFPGEGMRGLRRDVCLCR